MRTIRLSPALSDAEAAALAGTLLTDDSYDTLLTEDADVLKPDGTPLLKFRRGLLPNNLCKAAWQNLRDAATPTDNRGIAAGADVPVDDPSKVRATTFRTRKIKRDGTISRTSYAARAVNSGVVGYFDRSARFPYCRLTAYAMEHPERFQQALPFFRAVSDAFAQLMPDRYAAQMAYIRRTSPDFRIHGTAFTTVTVNKNWQTAVHQDAGDLREGFGVMAALRAGRYSGGYLVFPQYRVAVDLRTTDLICADVHEWHGNTPLVGHGPFERISCVFYYRTGMENCGTAAQELARAKSRKPGDPLKHWKPVRDA